VCRLKLLLALASQSFSVQVPWDSWPYFTVSDIRLPKPGGPRRHIYIHQEQGGPIIPPSSGFPFRLLLRLAVLRWIYSNPVLQKRPRLIMAAGPLYVAPAPTAHKTPLPSVLFSCVRV
jgi:hypothetical protein